MDAKHFQACLQQGGAKFSTGSPLFATDLRGGLYLLAGHDPWALTD
jgi:hypothetical protein